MAIEIKVPSVGESINEVTLIKWIKKDGDWVDRDEVIAELESEKATFEINAEQQGILHTVAKENDTLKVGDIACTIDDKAEKPASVKKENGIEKKEEKQDAQAIESKESSSQNESSRTKKEMPLEEKTQIDQVKNKDIKATPVAAAILADKKIDVKKVIPTGSNGKITKHDVMDALSTPGRAIGKELFSRSEKPEKMSNLRKTISRRLVEAKNTKNKFYSNIIFFVEIIFCND